MRWPWQRRTEKRESGGDFSDAVVRLIEAQAAGSAADASSTAAVEAASGALSRAFAAAEVVGPPWVQQAISPATLAQIGRDLIRRGDSLHVIRLDAMGGVKLIPCSSWHWKGSHDPATWTVRATAYGPSTSTTWNLPAAGVVFVTWGSTPGQPYVGVAPMDWAHTTGRLNAAAERALADEAGGPVAQILTVPEGQAGDEDDEGDPLATLRTAIAGARGKALLLETTASGYGEGKSAAPRDDMKPHPLHPAPAEGLVKVADQAFMRTLAATGTPPDLFAPADGTAQREALRRWHMGVVRPLARVLEAELEAKLDTPVTLKFDGYPLDLQSRAATFQKLVAGGVAVTEALATAGLLADDAADPDIVHALAKCLALQRDLFRDSAETVAERHNMSVNELIAALEWYTRAAPHYRNTPEAVAAEAAATSRRHPLLLPRSEHQSAIGEGVGGRMDADRRHPTRQRRRCVRCDRRFQPTVKRWQTCRTCYALAEDFGIPF